MSTKNWTFSRQMHFLASTPPQEQWWASDNLIGWGCAFKPQKGMIQKECVTSIREISKIRIESIAWQSWKEISTFLWSSDAKPGRHWDAIWLMHSFNADAFWRTQSTLPARPGKKPTVNIVLIFCSIPSQIHRRTNTRQMTERLRHVAHLFSWDSHLFGEHA